MKITRRKKKKIICKIKVQSWEILKIINNFTQPVSPEHFLTDSLSNTSKWTQIITEVKKSTQCKRIDIFRQYAWLYLNQPRNYLISIMPFIYKSIIQAVKAVKNIRNCLCSYAILNKTVFLLPHELTARKLVCQAWTYYMGQLIST